MWTGIWRSLGKATGFVATSLAGTSAPEGSISSEPAPSAESGGVVVRLGREAGRLCGTASVQGTRACSEVQGLVANLIQKVAGDGSCLSDDAADKQAESIALILREGGVVPNRLGIDGLPGSGKSTLARALARKLDLRWISLDHKNLSNSRELERERVVVEHHRLFRTQDVNVFDAIVYINELPENARAWTVRRGRGAILATMLDYHKLKNVGDMAFEVCDGKPMAIPDSNLTLKIKPPGGFRAIESIVGRLREAGLYTPGMSKEETLFLLALGEPKGGLKAYYTPFASFAALGGLAGWIRGTEASPTTDSQVSASS